ncbi:hypothetical protein D3C75_1209970 [compost metagenome]
MGCGHLALFARSWRVDGPALAGGQLAYIILVVDLRIIRSFDYRVIVLRTAFVGVRETSRLYRELE